MLTTESYREVKHQDKQRTAESVIQEQYIELLLKANKFFSGNSIPFTGCFPIFTSRFMI